MPRKRGSHTFKTIDQIRSRCRIVDTHWLWQGAKTYQGYGMCKHGSKNHLVHRITFELARGVTILNDRNKWVLHGPECPTNCCNPDHMVLGSAYENRLHSYSDLDHKDSWKTKGRFSDLD